MPSHVRWPVMMPEGAGVLMIVGVSVGVLVVGVLVTVAVPVAAGVPVWVGLGGGVGGSYRRIMPQVPTAQPTLSGSIANDRGVAGLVQLFCPTGSGMACHS